MQTDSVEVGFHIDNVRWAPDGSLLAAGHLGKTMESIFQCMGQQQCESVTSRVVKVDPDRLTAEEIVRYPPTNSFSSAPLPCRLTTRSGSVGLAVPPGSSDFQHREAQARTVVRATRRISGLVLVPPGFGDMRLDQSWVTQ